MNTNLINLTHGNDTNPLLYIMTTKLYIQRDIQCLSRNDASIEASEDCPSTHHKTYTGRLHQYDKYFCQGQGWQHSY